MPSSKVTGAQIRAARGFLDWSRNTLAARAGVSVPTVQAIEAHEGIPEAKEGVETTRDHRAAKIAESLEKITAALEDAGIDFLDANGVSRERKRDGNR